MTDRKTFTLSELVEDYLAERVPSAASCRNYRRVVQLWIKDTSIELVHNVHAGNVRGWRDLVFARASAQTWNTYRRRLRAIWNYAVRRQICAKNPFADTVAACAPILRKKTVNSVDLNTIICALLEHHQGEFSVQPAWFWATVIKTFYYTGIRRRQLVERRWKDIRFSDGTMHLQAATSTSHREWYIPIDECLLSELENLHVLPTHRIGHVPDGEHQVFNLTLFRNRFQGNTLTVDQVSGAFQRLSTALKIRISPHRLRHTIATVTAPRDIRALQELLGHTSVLTTMQYIHPDVERMRSLLQEITLT